MEVMWKYFMGKAHQLWDSGLLSKHDRLHGGMNSISLSAWRWTIYSSQYHLSSPQLTPDWGSGATQRPYIHMSITAGETRSRTPSVPSVTQDQSLLAGCEGGCVALEPESGFTGDFEYADSHLSPGSSHSSCHLPDFQA